MASNWIKWVVGLGRRSEVIDISTLMKIHRLHAAGLCCELWEWTDANATIRYDLEGCPGFVPNLSPTEETFDAIFGVPGFAAALIQVKWLQLRSNVFWFPNLGRHNGEPAKKRALEAAKKAEQRSRVSRKCPEKNGTSAGPEKSREEDTSKDVSRAHTPEEGKRPQREPPFKPPTLEEVRLYIHANGHKADPQQWFDFYSAKGWMIGKTKMRDWRAAIRTWNKPRDGTQNARASLPPPEYKPIKPAEGVLIRDD